MQWSVETILAFIGLLVALAPMLFRLLKYMRTRCTKKPDSGTSICVLYKDEQNEQRCIANNFQLKQSLSHGRLSTQILLWIHPGLTRSELAMQN